MSDFVLRGFCQCGDGMTFDEHQRAIKMHLGHYGNSHSNTMHEIKMTWFLSAKQIKIIHDSDFITGIKNDWEAVYILLDENPFLVARILKEAGEKK